MLTLSTAGPQGWGGGTGAQVPGQLWQPPHRDTQTRKAGSRHQAATPGQVPGLWPREAEGCPAGRLRFWAPLHLPAPHSAVPAPPHGTACLPQAHAHRRQCKRITLDLRDPKEIKNDAAEAQFAGVGKTQTKVRDSQGLPHRPGHAAHHPVCQRAVSRPRSPRPPRGSSPRACPRAAPPCGRPLCARPPGPG